MRAATVVFAVLLLSSETLRADAPPNVRLAPQVEALLRLPSTTANPTVTAEQIEKSQAATPNGKCSGHSGVPQVRALALLPNERTQCAYFVA